LIIEKVPSCDFLNPDFAAGFVMRSSKAIQKRVSGDF
jgi:hypothetical protein